MVDLIARLGLPVVVVARSGLGTINHTLLTLEALRARVVAVAGVVMVGRSECRQPRRDRALRPRAGRRRAAAARSADAGTLRAAAGALIDPEGALDACCADDGVAMAMTLDSARDARRACGIRTRRCSRGPTRLPIVRGEGVYLYTEDGRRSARRHLVVVGEHSRPFASEAERGAGRAGAASSSTSSSPTARIGRRSNWPSGWSTCCRAA